MTGDMHYAHEKLTSAVYGMAVSTEPLRDRVLSAWLGFHTIDEGDLPEDAHADFRSLMTRMTWTTPKGDEGTIGATLALVSDEEAARLAQLICDLACRVDSTLLHAARLDEIGGER